MSFNAEDSWSFDNDFDEQVVIFGVDNSSFSYSGNRKNSFSILREGPTSVVNDSSGSPKKTSLILILVKQTKKVA